jgi:multidrug efflux pump subunit AcrB
MFNVSAWAIKRPLPALMIFFVLCVAGMYGFIKLPICTLPRHRFPMVAVTISLPGAPPSQLETEVTRKVEDAVATISGVKRVMSSVNEGVSTTTIEFQLEVDLQVALDDVRDAVSRIRMDLPLDIQEPVVVEDGSGRRHAADLCGRFGRACSPTNCRGSSTATVSKAMYGIKGVAVSSAWAASSARSASISIRKR